MDALLAISPKDAPTGSADGGPMAISGSSAAQGHKIPLTTYLTPYALVVRRLLAYERDAHLMPSIFTYYKQVS